MVWGALISILLLSDPAGFDQSLRAGLVALNSNDLGAAQTQLESAAKLNPREPKVWLALAQTYSKQGRPEAADQAASKAARFAGSSDAVVLHGLALYYARREAYEKAGDFEARYAAKVASSGAEARERAAGYYFASVQPLLRDQRFEPALSILERGLKASPENAQLELARGVALYGLRRFQEAIDSFVRTSKLAPDVEQPYLFLGRMVDVSESKLPNVTAVLAARATVRPDDPMAVFLYAKALATSASADAGEVERLLRRSIELDGNRWESHFELGVRLEKRRAFADAAAELERSVVLNPNEAAAHFRLARVYDRLGRSEDAVRERALHAKLTGGAETPRELKLAPHGGPEP